MKAFRAIAAVLVAGASLLLAARAPAGAPLGLDEWLRASLPRHPEVREADLALLEHAAREREDALWDDPQVRLGREIREGRGDQSEVRLRLPLPSVWTLQTGRRLGTAGQALVRQGRTTALVGAYAELKELFLEAAWRAEDARLRRGHADALAAEVARAGRLREARQLAGDDWLRIEADAARARVLAARAALEAGSLAADMAAHSGIAPERCESPDTSLIDMAALLVPLPELDRLRGEALAGSPLLDATAALRQLEAARAADARWRMLPSPQYLQASWVGDSGQDRDDWTIQMEFSLPVFSYFRERAVANARAAHADALEAVQRDLIARTLAQAHRKAAIARQYLLEVEPHCRRIDQQAGDFLASGAATDPVERVRRIEARTQARRDLLEARHTLARALLDLESLYGIHAPAVIINHYTHEAPAP